MTSRTCTVDSPMPINCRDKMADQKMDILRRLDRLMSRTSRQKKYRRDRIISLMITAMQRMLDMMRAEEEEDEMLITLLILTMGGRRRVRKRREEEPTDLGSISIPEFYDDLFKSAFNISRTTFEEILSTLGPSLNSEGIVGRPRTLPQKQLLVSLWVLSTSESYRSVGDRFGISKSSVNELVNRVVSSLIKNSPLYIKWPMGEDKKKVIDGFGEISGFPGIIGAIDGLHISIKTPSHDPEKYLNKEQFHSIILQAVCDHRMVFTDCFCGYPGSASLEHVYMNSDLKIQTDLKEKTLFEEGMHLVGNSAYPLNLTLMTPFKSVSLTEKEEQFNSKLFKTGAVIERAFSQLKGRFRRLEHLEMSRLQFIPFFILSCCILHNMYILKDDIMEIPNEDTSDISRGKDVQIYTEISDEAIKKRECLVNEL